MYFYVFQSEVVDGNYTIGMTDLFYKYMLPYYKGDSYFNVLYRLFGLVPQDFYHYISYKYKAHFRKHPTFTKFAYTFFINEQDANMFCREINKRFDYCVKHSYF